MYELRVRDRNSIKYDIYDIYMNNKRIRDENDLCIRIREDRADVVFFNAYTAHNLLDIDTILNELIEILMIINNKEKWRVCFGYDYPINKELDIILNKIYGE